MPFFLTVDWCARGRRGIFAHRDGSCFRKDNAPHTESEIAEILGPFTLVLSPESVEYTEQSFPYKATWMPLAEYSGVYGIAVSAGDGAAKPE